MKTRVYFCACGDNISSKMDVARLHEQVGKLDGVDDFVEVPFLCAEDGLAQMEKDLRERPAERVVIGACSPREHEATFRKACQRCGVNPFLMQMANLREQVAWVTSDRDAATAKAFAYLRAALRRVERQEPLQVEKLPVSTDALIIGAGPAGVAAALSLSEAGRKVVLVERSPVVGGLPVRYDEVFPTMECGSCMLEPMLGKLMHDSNIEVLTGAEVSDVAGFFGHFDVGIRKRPRHVSLSACIGCGECIPPCPADAKNPYAAGMGRRKAIDFAFMGGLPNAPYLDDAVCVRAKGEDCQACVKACPVPEAILLDEKPQRVERAVGAIVVATGAGLYDASRVANLGYGRYSDVVTNLELEALLVSNGPTGGKVVTEGGAAPKEIAIVHCVGSLDSAHREYCSGVCCGAAFKYDELLRKKLGEVRLAHFTKALSLPGKDGSVLLSRAAKHGTDVVFYRSADELAVSADAAGRKLVTWGGGARAFDLVVLCPALIPADGAEALAKTLDLKRDRHGFFEELHGRTDPAKSKVRGILLAGACQAPMDIASSVTTGQAAAAHVLSGLVPGRELEIEPVHAEVDESRCSGCKTCLRACPFKAIAFDEAKKVSRVNPVLCLGCGTCVAACPTGAMQGHHFKDEQILAEIEEALS